MTRLVKKGLEKHEAVADPSFDRFYQADTNSGSYWARQQEETFKKGLEKLYGDVKGV
jgi:hypothetical protein